MHRRRIRLDAGRAGDRYSNETLADATCFPSPDHTGAAIDSAFPIWNADEARTTGKFSGLGCDRRGLSRKLATVIDRRYISRCGMNMTRHLQAPPALMNSVMASSWQW